jgi:hypothetical protein
MNRVSIAGAVLAVILLGALLPRARRCGERSRACRPLVRRLPCVRPDRSESVPQGPPTFQEVARSGLTADQVRAFLSHPHGPMPDLSLTRAEIDDLINYIATLR